jgi:hypothetical protein
MRVDVKNGLALTLTGIELKSKLTISVLGGNLANQREQSHKLRGIRQQRNVFNVNLRNAKNVNFGLRIDV